MTAKRMTFRIIGDVFVQGVEKGLCKFNGNDWIMLELFLYYSICIHIYEIQKKFKKKFLKSVTFF